MEIETSLEYNLKFNITGNIKYGTFLTKPVDLGYVPYTTHTSHDLELFNPYDKPAEIQLFIVPTQFLNVDDIDQEIINQIKNREKNKSDTLCMANSYMTPATIKYYAKRIYSDKLVYLPNIQPKSHKHKKFVCFKIPENDKDSEMLFIKITTLNNYFFEFVHDRSRKNFLKSHIVLISDFDKFNNQRKNLEKNKTLFLSKIYRNI